MTDRGPEIVTFKAWAYDPRFHALQREFSVAPEVHVGGEIIYRLPPYSTLVAPPDGIPPGRQAVFIEKSQHWIVVSDHRGEWWLDEMGRPRQIERLGNPTLWGMREINKRQESA
jgi:hypothetical protein